MKRDSLIAGLAATYGKTKAQEVLEAIIQDAGLPSKERYTRTEIVQLAEFMETSQNRFIRIIGKFVRVKATFSED